jgi:hypothetical protein
MFSNETQKKLEDIVGGIGINEQADTCTAIRNLLCSSFTTSTTVKKDFEGQAIIKEKQVKFLKDLATKHNYWVENLPDEKNYLTEGGEAKVYLHTDNKNVIKLNDGIYYATWLEFFNVSSSTIYYSRQRLTHF